jgi:DNA (cytosine-5)-methyltransferase 1
MNRAPLVRLYADEIIVDSFAGGGGASLGIEQALGRAPDIAINHDKEAISMHRMNHPGTQHYIEDVWKVNPRKVTAGKRVALMWLSPDCKHFSKAKGGKPRNKKIRALAWIAVYWAKSLPKSRRPRVIVLENVEEFQDWGPLLESGQPCPERKGKTFRKFVRQLQRLGYVVQWQQLVAADYGSPTSRRRLFLVARCDGEPIVWPDASHGKGRQPYRTAAECISWEVPCPSIFKRAKPLAANTERRIARGIEKFVKVDPFIVPVMHGGDARVYSIREPLRTITAAHRGEFALVAPSMIAIDNQSEKTGAAWSAKEPLRTITVENRHALTAATLIQTGYGEREGQSPRVPGLHKPLGTVVGGGVKHAVVGAFLAKHFGGHETPGSPLRNPMDTVTARDHHALVASSLVKLRGTCNHGQRVTEPLATISAQGNHFAEVRAFLMKYHRDGGQHASLKEPMPTVVANDSLALVEVKGEQYMIADIGMRMLQPRELFRAQGFPEEYVIERGFHGEAMTKEAQVRMCGNSVPPALAAAVVRAQFGLTFADERKEAA